MILEPRKGGSRGGGGGGNGAFCSWENCSDASKAGIVISAILGLALIVGVILCCWASCGTSRRRRRRIHSGPVTAGTGIEIPQNSNFGRQNREEYRRNDIIVVGEYQGPIPDSSNPTATTLPPPPEATHQPPYIPNNTWAPAQSWATQGGIPPAPAPAGTYMAQDTFRTH